ncbi:hypothetical protein IGI42_004375 [Enterococcus sp. AZ109]
MQNIIRIFYRGNIKIGATVERDDGTWVITDILSIQKSDHENYPMEMQAVIQKVNSPSDYDEFEPTNVYEEHYRNSQEIEDYGIAQLGDTEASDNVCTIVTDVLSVTYKEGAMTIEAELALFVPWSDEEMKEAVKKEKIRRRKLNVI